MDAVTAAGSRPWLAVGQEIADLLGRFDEDGFAALLSELADEQRRWFFTGQGRSGLSAKMAAMRLMHLGRQVHMLGEVTAPSVRSGDGLLVVSGSGTTPVSLGFARIAKAEGARVVLLTYRPDSPIAQMADVVLTIPVEQSQQLGGSLFEQSSLIALDAAMFAIAAELPDAPGRLAHLHTNMQ